MRWLRRVLLLVLLFLALAFVLASEAAAQGGEIEVVSTAYSCSYHKDNRMTNTPGMCRVTRWGGANVHEPGMACPASWRGRVFEVEGMVLSCDDTPASEWIHGLPHVDVRLSSYEAAYQWGLRTITIREVTHEATNAGWYDDDTEIERGMHPLWWSGPSHMARDVLLWKLSD